VHHAFVELAGEKMSKSSGNYTSLVDLLDSADERAFRLLVLQSHYRSPLEVTAETIAAAESSLARLDAMARRLGAGDGLALAPVRLAASSAEPMSRGGVDIVKHVERFNARMEDDLDTPAAISEVFDLVRAANAAAEAGEVVRASSMASAASSLLASVGLMLKAASGEVDAISEDLLARREAARREKDFALADSLRDELLARGWIVEDLPNGSKLRRSHQ
jgi:cysteinyl-tRNA synthetase